MNTEPLHNYILQSLDNMRIAAAVRDAWPETRIMVANAFLDRLSAKLVKALPGWKAEKWKTFFIDPWPGLYVFKPAWEDQYSVVLQSNEAGDAIHLGVQRDQNHIAERPHDERVLDVVRTIHPSARAQPWWEATIRVRAPATDWSTPETIWRMHTDEAFLNDVFRQLVEVAKLTEGLIDELVARGDKAATK